jgi:hypothetical protein
MIVSPSVSLFLESIYMGEKCHNAQFLSDDISRIIEKLSSSHVVGAVTDNTSTNTVAWSLLKQRFPGILFQGCASHCLHLLVKDIFCATKTKRGQNVATYSDDYPFEYLLEFVEECKELVSFFHNHNFYQVLLAKSLEEKGLRMLQPPAPTRWGSFQAFLYSILKAKRVLHCTVSDRNFIYGTSKQKVGQIKIRETVMSESFIFNLSKSVKILEPIDKLVA